jgi:hypothetical protein
MSFLPAALHPAGSCPSEPEAQLSSGSWLVLIPSSFMDGQGRAASSRRRLQCYGLRLLRPLARPISPGLFEWHLR